MSELKIKMLIEKANKFINTAKLALKNEDYDSTVSRTYYAMFYVSKAILITKNLKAKTHSALVSLFGLHFVKNNIFSKEMGKLLNNALEMRISGDYEDENLINKEAAEELLIAGQDFIKKAIEYLKNNKFL